MTKTRSRTHFELRELETSDNGEVQSERTTKRRKKHRATHMQAFPPARNVILPNTSRVSHCLATNTEFAGDSQVRVDAWNAGLLERAG